MRPSGLLKMLAMLGLGGILFTMSDAPGLAAEDGRRSIRVRGVGGVDAAPDQAIVLAAVVDQKARAGAALEANSVAMRGVLAKLAEFGVAEADIRTRGFAVTPIFERRERGTATPRIIGYRAVNRVEVKVRALARLGAILDALVAAGADRIDGIRFSIANPGPLADEARRLAMADALRKAKLYAEAAGVSVGRVLDIAEDNVRIPRPRMIQAAKMDARAAVPISPGEQRVSATVTVVYQME